MDIIEGISKLRQIKTDYELLASQQRTWANNYLMIGSLTTFISIGEALNNHHDIAATLGGIALLSLGGIKYRTYLRTRRIAFGVSAELDRIYTDQRRKADEGYNDDWVFED